MISKYFEQYSSFSVALTPFHAEFDKWAEEHQHLSEAEQELHHYERFDISQRMLEHMAKKHYEDEEKRFNFWPISEF